MPEEINRRLTDHLSTHLFTTSRDGDENLQAEGIPAARVYFVGNTMIDTLLRFRAAARERKTAARLGLSAREYAVLTLHRPNTVDAPHQLEQVLDAVIELSVEVPVVFPIHPRTRQQLGGTDLYDRLLAAPGMIEVESLGYLDFVNLLDEARLVLTDSGGIQEETTVLGVPCLTLRESTERPVTVTSGTNTIVGTDPAAILSASRSALEDAARVPAVPELWDGHAGERIVEILAREIIGSAATETIA